jgi:formylglycine-generating enzyme required for sulfatase activity
VESKLIKRYFDFELLIQADGLDYSLDINARPFAINLPKPIKVSAASFKAATAFSSAGPEEDAAVLGKHLFEDLFGGEVGRLFAEYRGSKTVPPNDGGVRLCLSSNENMLAGVQWEGLCGRMASAFKFLALDPQTPVVRTVRIGIEPFVRPLRLPLRILVVVAAPRRVHPVDAGKARAMIEEALSPLKDAAAVQVEFLGFMADEVFSFERLQEKISSETPPFDIVHIIADGLIEHGIADEPGRPGKIALVDTRQNQELVEAQSLAAILRSRQVMLVLLQSCFSGAVDPSAKRFTAMAQALVAAGVPAVLAFRPEMRQDVTRTFLSVLYSRWLISGCSLEDGLTQARVIVEQRTKDATWTEPVLYIYPSLHLDIERERVCVHTHFRQVDAALPAAVRVGRSTELVVLIRPPGGRGLRDLITAISDDFEAKPENIEDTDDIEETEDTEDTEISEKFGINFPRDERGVACPGKVRVRVEAPDLLEAPQEKVVQVPPGDASVCVHFDLVPRLPGLASVWVRILQAEGEEILGELSLHSEVVYSTEPAFVAKYQVIAGKEESGHEKRETHTVQGQRKRRAYFANLWELQAAESRISKPTWTGHSGQDQYGTFADLVLAKGVVTRLRWIPPGRFLMGSPDDEPGRLDFEGPQCQVTLTEGYWLADAPCTQNEWLTVMGTTPSHFKGANRPVECVSWEDCQQYCKKLAERFPGLLARLPSEAEWEYACRAGTTSAFNDGSTITDPEGPDPALAKLGWFYNNSGTQTERVRELAPNRWGLFDMHGNVWEWCRAWNSNYATGESMQTAGAASGDVYLSRGGSWADLARYCRSAVRVRWMRDEPSKDRGFRIAASQ